MKSMFSLKKLKENTFVNKLQMYILSTLFIMLMLFFGTFGFDYSSNNKYIHQKEQNYLYNSNVCMSFDVFLKSC